MKLDPRDATFAQAYQFMMVWIARHPGRATVLMILALLRRGLSPVNELSDTLWNIVSGLRGPDHDVGAIGCSTNLKMATVGRIRRWLSGHGRHVVQGNIHQTTWESGVGVYRACVGTSEEALSSSSHFKSHVNSAMYAIERITDCRGIVQVPDIVEAIRSAYDVDIDNSEGD